jgi:hypothetical protein
MACHWNNVCRNLRYWSVNMPATLLNYVQPALHTWGTRWRSWLRHCVTSRKVAGSISDVIIGIFYCFNPSGRTVVLGSTQPLTEMSTWGWGRGKGGRCLGQTTLPPTCTDCLEILGASTSWSCEGLCWPVMGLLYLFCYTAYILSPLHLGTYMQATVYTHLNKVV